MSMDGCFEGVPCGTCMEPCETTDVYCSSCGTKNAIFDADEFQIMYGRSPDEARIFYCTQGDYHLGLLRGVVLLGDAVIYFCHFC